MHLYDTTSLSLATLQREKKTTNSAHIWSNVCMFYLCYIVWFTLLLSMCYSLAGYRFLHFPNILSCCYNLSSDTDSFQICLGHNVWAAIVFISFSHECCILVFPFYLCSLYTVNSGFLSRSIYWFRQNCV